MRSLNTRIESMWYSGKGSLWLAPLSFLYGAIMGLRSLLYRLRYCRATDALLSVFFFFCLRGDTEHESGAH